MGYTYKGKLTGENDPWQQPRHLKVVPEPKPAPTPKPTPAPKPKRQLAPCGTNAAYNRHRKHNENPCRRCTEARREYVAARRELPPEARRRAEAQCGTYAGAVRHYRNKEHLCEPCAEARRTYLNAYRARKKAA